MPSSPPQDANPYAPSPGCAAGSGYLPDEQPLLREEVEAFAGRNGRVYWELLQPASHSRSLLAGFNFAAAAFSFLWLLHRKMYWEFLAVTVMTVPVALAFAFGSTNPAAAALWSLSPLVIMATVGTLANGLYLRRLCVAVAKERQHESDPVRRLSLLAKRGGTSWFAPVIYMILYVVLMGILKGRLMPW
jgi:hypothetical protein